MKQQAPTESDVLVWGACGFIGRHLVARLLEVGARVSVLTRPRESYSPPPWSSRVRWFELKDATNERRDLEAAIASAAVIYDLAGSSGAVASNRDPQASLDAICRSQLQFLELCAASGRRPHLVFASSRLVYGRTGSAPVAEDVPVAPQSMYAAHKLCVENYHQILAAGGGITYTICRISNPYGQVGHCQRKSYGVLNSMIYDALAGAPITLFGDGSQLRDYLYITDLIDALVLSGTEESARNQTFNIGRGIGISLHEAALQIQEQTGAGILFTPWPPEYALVESGDFVADIGKAARLLGFCPKYTFREGVAATIACGSMPEKVAALTAEGRCSIPNAPGPRSPGSATLAQP